MEGSGGEAPFHPTLFDLPSPFISDELGLI